MCASEQKPSLRSERICLFGGTFDPIHLGHVHIASQAREHLQLDRVIFLPCKQSPHKRKGSLANEAQRLEMCKLATADLPWAEIDDYDLTAPAPSYSWRTAEVMKGRFPNAELYWLMGTDQWDVLQKWDRPEHLAELVEFIVFSRGSTAEPRNNMTLHAIEGHHPASATEIRNTAATKLKKHWLHNGVSEYIQSNELYSEE